MADPRARRARPPPPHHRGARRRPRPQWYGSRVVASEQSLGRPRCARRTKKRDGSWLQVHFLDPGLRSIIVRVNVAHPADQPAIVTLGPRVVRVWVTRLELLDLIVGSLARLVHLS